MKYSPYSYSKITCYESCPKKFQYRYIDGIKVPAGTHLIKGEYIHDLLDRYKNPDKGKHRKVELTPEERQEYQEITARFIASDLGKEYFSGEVIGREVEIAIDTKFKPCKYWGDDCVYRGSIDRLRKVSDTELDIIDWKTGKFDERRYVQEQLRYYALWCFLKYPEIKIVNCHFVYVETLDKRVYSYTREILNISLKGLLKRISSIEKSKYFLENKTVLCNYCDYYKNGTCKVME